MQKNCAIFKINFCFLLSFLVTVADHHDELLTQFKTAKKAILFDNIVGDLASQDACAAEKWNNLEKYVCRCCIVRTADKIMYEKRDGKTILEQCKKSGHCTDALMQKLKQDEGLEQATDTDFINIMYDRSLIIKTIDITSYKTLFEAGIFSDEDLKQFLVQAYKEHKILNSAFADVSCLSIQNLAGKGGGTTGQLFMVKSACGKQVSEFIIKEIIHAKEEAFDLALASQYEPLKPYIAPNEVKDFPIIELPIAYLHYSSRGGKDHYLSIMHKARGSEFFEYMQKYIAVPNEYNKSQLNDAYAVIGKTLGNFHKVFMRNKDNGSPDATSLKGNTIIHGDFHPRNYFYDEQQSKVYWIDNIEFGKAIFKPQLIYADLSWMLFLPFINKFVGLDEKIRNNPKIWFATFYPAFFKAYLDAFGGDWFKHAQELKEILNSPDDRTRMYWVENKDKNIAGYCVEIIDALISEKKQKTGV